MKQIKTQLIVVGIILLAQIHIEAQITDIFSAICDSMKTIEDRSDINYEHLSRSRDYKVQIVIDTLLIEVTGVDSHVRSEDPRDRRPIYDVYKMNVNDIAKIKFSIDSNQLYDYHWTEAQIEFEALRFYPLFKHNYEGKTLKQDVVKLRVINQKDTVHFRQLAQLLNEHIDVTANYIPPSCATEEVTINTKIPQKINTIDVNNLEESILMNGTHDLEGEIHQVLISYLNQENIKKVYGSVIIDASNQFQYFDSHQNQMYNYLNTLDSIPAGYRVLKETGFFKITDEHKEHITTLLKKQEWTSGKCNKKPVNSYFDFMVENKNYIKPK